MLVTLVAAYCMLVRRRLDLVTTAMVALVGMEVSVEEEEVTGAEVVAVDADLEEGWKWRQRPWRSGHAVQAERWYSQYR